MIVRQHYLKMLKNYRDVPLVKILAGIRRCGKSTILDMLREDLLKNGVDDRHVIYTSYTSEELEGGLTDREMYRQIKEKLVEGGHYYLLLDEV